MLARLISGSATLVFFVAFWIPALANGVARVQESDGTVRTFKNVSITVEHRTLRMTTADGKGTLIVNQAACSYVGAIERCFPKRMSLEEHGKTRIVNFTSGTIYANLTDQTQQLPSSSTHIPAKGILLSAGTKIGTYVSVSGTIDSIVR